MFLKFTVFEVCVKYLSSLIWSLFQKLFVEERNSVTSNQRSSKNDESPESSRIQVGCAALDVILFNKPGWLWRFSGLQSWRMLRVYQFARTSTRLKDSWDSWEAHPNLSKDQLFVKGYVKNGDFPWLC